jgi:hypothetical protein
MPDPGQTQNSSKRAGRGALGTPTNSPMIDQGTLCRQASAAPGPNCQERRKGPALSDEELTFALRDVGLNPINHTRLPWDQLAHLHAMSVQIYENFSRDPQIGSKTLELQEMIAGRLAYLVTEAERDERVKRCLASGTRVDPEDIGLLFHTMREEALGLRPESATGREAQKLVEQAMKNNARIANNEVKKMLDDKKSGRAVNMDQFKAAVSEAVMCERSQQLLGAAPDRPEGRVFGELMAEISQMDGVRAEPAVPPVPAAPKKPNSFSPLNLPLPVPPAMTKPPPPHVSDLLSRRKRPQTLELHKHRHKKPPSTIPGPPLR